MIRQIRYFQSVVRNNSFSEAAQLAKEDKAALVIGYLRCYSGQEFHLALEEFSAKYPDGSVKIEYGNHEELYELLQAGF